MTRALTKPSRRDLANYDPARGLKSIAVAEAAEKHFARAKDATQLTRAIRAKLEAQADFVTWWDHVASKDKGGQPRRTRSSSATGSRAGRDGIPERYVIDRWRKRLGDEDAFEATFAAACARYIKILELEAGAHVGHATGNPEWYSPADHIEAARVVLGDIDLDPATSATANTAIKAATIYTATDDGLAHDWIGRVWMNPPYAQPAITNFCAKLAASVRAGTVPAAVVLINNATETQWFRELADVAAAMCFPTGRLRFWGPGKEPGASVPLQGQAVVYIGDDVDRFCDTFKPFGFVVTVRR